MITPPKPQGNARDCSPHITVIEEAQQITIRLAANRGNDEVLFNRFFGWVWGVVAITFVFAVGFCMIRGEALAALWVSVWGLVFLIITLAMVRRQYCNVHRVGEYVISAEGLTIEETRFWGRRRHHWRRGEVVEIRLEGHWFYSEQLVICDRDGGRVSVARGVYEWDLLWLRDTVKSQLGIA